MKEQSDYREPGGEKIQEESSSSESWENDVEWDGTEAELIVEDDVEEYEENQTGIKVKYVLSESEISEIFKHTESHKGPTRARS